MSKERHQRISDLFLAVCDLDADERDRVLDEHCANDAELRTDVEKLLNLDRQTAIASLTQIVERGAHAASAAVAKDHFAPTELGPYRIIKEIGEGGMSVVYEAEQSEPVKRRVALKVIRPGMDTREVIARFESERQALALMDHPFIAKIFDAGASDQGRPYFVMELVHGEPITDYCDRAKLTVKQRLRLFLSVCAAIEHAHQKGVVHRDLKPSNILVAEHEGRPAPKVIDFGIAKAMDASLSEDPLVTRLGQTIGTPGYMSPEQAGARVDDVDTRTDVYALGVVLYQLLVGVLPHDHRRLSPAELTEAASQRAAPRPSTRLMQLSEGQAETASARRTDRRSLHRTLASSLDWVVLKAMESARERRYQSVFEFSTDIENYLSHRPVMARPPSTGYVLGQFVRRNRRSVAAAAVVTVALIAGIATATVGMLRAQAAEALAKREATTAKRVTDTMISMFESEDPGRSLGKDVLVSDVLDSGRRKIERELADEPEVQAALMQTLGTLYNRLGEPAVAVPLLEQALAQQERANGSESTNRAITLAELGEALRVVDRTDDGRTAHERALAIRQAAHGPDHIDVAMSLADLGMLERGAGNYPQAERLLTQALTIARAQTTRDDVALETLSRALNAMANVKEQNGELAEAEAAHREALDIKRELHGAIHPRVATTLNNLGAVLAKQGKFAEAEDAYTQALTMREQVYKKDNLRISTTLNNLALLLVRQGRLDEAEEKYRRSLAIRRANGEVTAGVATALNNLAGLLRAQGKAEPALEAYRESLRVRRAVQGDEHPNTAITQMNLAEQLSLMGQHEESCGVMEPVRERLSGALKPGHWRLAMADGVWAACLASRGNFASAETLLIDALGVVRGARGDNSEYTRRTAQRLVELYGAWGKPQEQRHYEELLATLDRHSRR